MSIDVLKLKLSLENCIFDFIYPFSNFEKHTINKRCAIVIESLMRNTIERKEIGSLQLSENH